MDNQQGPIIWHIQLWSMLCGSPDVRYIFGEMDTHIFMAEFLHCSPETIRALMIGYVCILSRFSLSDSYQPDGLSPIRLLCPWDSPGKNNGVGFHALLQGISPTQWLNPALSHCRWILQPQAKPKNTDVGSLSHLQQIFLTQESN